MLARRLTLYFHIVEGFQKPVECLQIFELQYLRSPPVCIMYVYATRYKTIRLNPPPTLRTAAPWGRQAGSAGQRRRRSSAKQTRRPAGAVGGDTPAGSRTGTQTNFCCTSPGRPAAGHVITERRRSRPPADPPPILNRRPAPTGSRA